MNLEIVITLIGGLGLFLYGMKLMSDGLEKAAGAKMRNVLEFFTKNRFVGMLVGVLFTAIVQSSSATTVMVVSFVNSGLMSLLEASGVIMGANIGTTVTSQLIAFNLSAVAPLFLMAGVIMVMFSKKQNVKKIGEVVLGFGILFVGLNTMSGAMSTLKESPAIVDMLASLDNHFMAILMGFVITAILQSSSATVGIVLLLASQGLLNLPICFFLILGCNMGSCVSALIASLGGNKDAKRAAWIHFLFNIIGSAVIMIILTFGLDAVTRGIEYMSGGNAARGVANAHTIFKIFEVLILFPVMPWVVKATYFIVPGSDKKESEEFHLEYIGGPIISPTTSAVAVVSEIDRMGNIARDNLKRSINALFSLEQSEIDKVYEEEAKIDYLNREITDYLVKVTQMLPIADANKLGGLFHVVNDIERIGDHAENVADAARTRLDHNVDFSKKGQKELGEMAEMVYEIMALSLEMFTKNNREHLQEILDLEDKIDDKEKALQRSHVKRLTKNKCTPEAGMMFSDLASGLERVADHSTNIAFSILDEEPEEEAAEAEV